MLIFRYGIFLVRRRKLRPNNYHFKEQIMRTFREIFRWLVAVALAWCTMLAHAGPITGSISIGGSFELIDASGNQTSLSQSTGIDFIPLPPPNNLNTFIVTGSTGDFSGIPFLAVGNITDFQFAPFSGPIASFWDLSTYGFTFDLTSVTHVVKSLGTGAIALAGIGVIHSTIAGLDSTPGNWSLAGDTTNGIDFGWSSTTVPEPMTSALLGVGLLGFGFARALKKQPHPKF